MPSFAGIREILHHCGPLTMRDIAQFYPHLHYRDVAKYIAAMRTCVVTKQLYIQSWTMDGYGRRYPRPVYALGDKRDAPKPKPTTASERAQKYRQKRKPPKAPNSVFTWAAAQAQSSLDASSAALGL